MIARIEAELLRRWPDLFGTAEPPRALSIVQSAGTNWPSGRVRFAVLAGGHAPLVFVRVIRDRTRDAELVDLYELMRALWHHPRGRGRLPEPLMLGTACGQHFLVERAVEGESLWQGEARHGPEDFARWLARTSPVFEDLALASREGVDCAGPDDDVLDPLRRFADSAGCGERFVRLAASLRALRGSQPLRVLTHGDANPKNVLAKNVLAADDGSAALVDWETANRMGLPLVDLFYFATRCAYLGVFSPTGQPGQPAQRVVDFYATDSGSRDLVWAAARSHVESLGYPLAVAEPLFQIHFLYKAWLKSVASGADAPMTRLWLDLFLRHSEAAPPS